MKKLLFIFIFLAYISLSLCNAERLKGLSYPTTEKISHLKKRPTVGLVLSGGGAKGFAHIGVLEYMEKAGIKPDYIAGTSMGSVIGALYSLGYSAREIKKLVYSENWDFIISNAVKYTNMSMDAKNDAGKYFIEFSLKKNKFKLPMALIEGQHIMELINHYTAWQSYRINDFTKLPIPFFCVAINLETGKLKVFKEGYLPDAIRASTAIPSVFTPKIIDGIPYIDGGLKNNFPVNLMKKMFHPDIIIGSFVGFKPKPKEQLNTLTNILTQSMFFNAFQLLEKNKKECDILIEPKIDKYNTFSFDNYREIIETGEKAAKETYQEFLALKKILERYPEHVSAKRLPQIRVLKFDKIELRGISHLSPLFVREHLGLHEGKKYSRKQVETAISNLYGTGYFQYVTYKLQYVGGKNILIIRLKEKSDTLFKMGVKYNTDYTVTLLLNLTSFNFLMPNAKLKIEGQLSQSPSFNLSYQFLPFFTHGITNYINFINPSIGLSFNISSLNINLYDPKTKTNSSALNYLISNSNLFAKTEILNLFLFGIEGGINYSLIKETNYSQFVLQPGIFLKLDTRDDPFFPTQGIFLNLEARYLYTFKSDYPHSIVTRLDWKSYLTLFDILTLEPSFSIGLSRGLDLPQAYHFYLGGITTYPLFGSISLSALHPLDMAGQEAVSIQFEIRYRLSTRHFIELFINTGTTADSPEGLLNLDKYPYGIGIKYNYKSLLGPLEISAIYSNFSNTLIFYLNIGFSQ